MDDVRTHFGKYGWRPQKPDRRDRRYSAKYSTLRALPPAIDLRESMPPIFDQGALGSCTGNGFATQVQVARHVGGAPLGFTPSRLGIYYEERRREGTIPYDAGAEPRDGIKAIVENGVWPEDRPGAPENWPYDIDRFRDKPAAPCYTFGQDAQTLVYSVVEQNECQMKGVLATGLPIGIGFSVYESFETDEVVRTGIVPMPGSGERVLGGHWVVVVGYDDLGSLGPARHWIVRNSWGGVWGKQGYCFMPYEYLLDSDLSSDFWVVESVE